MKTYPALQPPGSSATPLGHARPRAWTLWLRLNWALAPFLSSIFGCREPSTYHWPSLSILGHEGKRRERRSSLSTTVSLPTISANAISQPLPISYGCASCEEEVSSVCCGWEPIMLDEPRDRALVNRRRRLFPPLSTTTESARLPRS